MDNGFLTEAIRLSVEKMQAGEGGPFGAVIVRSGEIIARGWNMVTSTNDPTAHAEVVALRDAATRVGNYRLPGATLYVTLEPCLMCVGAFMHARVATVVYGATEPRTGAMESTQRAHEHAALHHSVTVVSGVLAAECRDLLQTFFQERRAVSS